MNNECIFCFGFCFREFDFLLNCERKWDDDFTVAYVESCNFCSNCILLLHFTLSFQGLWEFKFESLIDWFWIEFWAKKKIEDIYGNVWQNCDGESTAYICEGKLPVTKCNKKKSFNIYNKQFKALIIRRMKCIAVFCLFPFTVRPFELGSRSSSILLKLYFYINYSFIPFYSRAESWSAPSNKFANSLRF